MYAALSACLVYLACVGFYQAGEKRTSVDRLRASPRERTYVRAASTVLLLAGFAPLAIVQGGERAVAVWLGVLAGAGGVSLMVAALAPARHLLTGAVSAIGVFVLAAGLAIRAAGA